MSIYKSTPKNITLLIGTCILFAASCLFANSSHAQTIKSYQKISDLQGGFAQAGGMLEKGDDFGEQVDNIGDLDGDGVVDLVVSVNFDDDGGENRGAIYVLFMNTDGTVKSLQKISSTQGGFTEAGGILDDFDSFGRGASSIGDLDNDGVLDIAVGAPGDDDNGSSNGAVYILFMNTDGTVKSQQKISELEGNLNRNIRSFGGDIAELGDINGDTVEDLFVQTSGGFYILFLNTDGTVLESTFYFQSGSSGFGQTGALIGDVDGDGVMDIATGSQFDDDGADNAGAVWILFMKADGSERNRVKISATTGGFTGLLEAGDEFGQSATPIGDRDGDGIPDLLVGAEHADSPDGSVSKTGEAWILYLNANGTVKSHELMRSGSENFTSLEANADFGQAVTYLGDLDGDGIGDVAVASDGDKDCNICGGNKGTMTGAVYVLFLGSPPGANQPPMLANIINQTTDENELLTINVMATDPETDPLILDATGVPLMSLGATFTDLGGGMGQFSWTPATGTATNSPYTVTFSATEDTMTGLSDSQSVTIFVNEVGSGGPTVSYEVEDLTIAASDGTTSSVTKSDAGASSGEYLQYNSNAVGEFVTFPITVSSAGAHTIGVTYHLTRYRGTFMVEVAESLGGAYTQIGTMNTTVNSGSSFPTLPMSATFSSTGTKYVRFTATGSNPNTGSEKMGLDKIVVTSQSGGGNQAPMLMNINPQTVTEDDPLTINVMATDPETDPLILDATGVPLMSLGATFTDLGGGMGQFSWTPATGTATNSPYTVTFSATEDTMTGLFDEKTVTITVLPFGTVGGSLSGNFSAFTNGNVNLTTQGTTDWAHWKGGATNLIRKNSTPMISDYVMITSETPSGAGSQATYDWSDGTPTASGSASDGVRVFNVGSGFRVIVPADTTPRTVNVYVGAKNARGQFTATLSDGTPAYSTLINQSSGLGAYRVELNYQASSANQTLTIEYTMETRYKSNTTGSQINLESATLF